MNAATAAARRLLTKLTVLAERGVNGERAGAAAKLARLKARFDFTAPDTQGPDLFAGVFYPASNFAWVHSFAPEQAGWAANVKWAIESACRIDCRWEGNKLLAQASPATVDKLADITRTITESFAALWARFSRVAGVQGSDQSVFIMGLYSGMMHEEKPAGERLPARVGVKATKVKGGRRVLAVAPGLAPHPYTVGVSLGKSIRFAVPLPDIQAQLEEIIVRGIETMNQQTRRAYFARLGAKGGRTGGAAKARTSEQARRAVKARWAKRKKTA